MDHLFPLRSKGNKKYAVEPIWRYKTGEWLMQILAGTLVVDLTRALSGPFSTMMLADFGADVVKIEPPQGDDSRAWGPYVNGESAFYMSTNRGKRSIVMDLKIPQAQELVRQMVAQADIIAENYRPGVMESFGLGYDALKKINPRLIYVSTSGFGQTGPFRMKAAYDMIVQAMGGMMSITGEEGGNPMRVGASIGDLTAGVYTAFGTMLALYARQITGVGQKVDISMLDCQVAFLENAIARYLYSGKVPEPVGNRHASISPFESYQAADGNVVIAVANQKQWLNFCDLIDRPDLAEDPRFAHNVDRVANRMAMNTILQPVIKAKTVSAWTSALEAAGIPCTSVNTVDQVLQNPQVLARNMIVELDHPVAGAVKMPGIPVKLSDTPGNVAVPPPLFGQHTDEILTNLLNLSQQEIADLKKSGAIK